MAPRNEPLITGALKTYIEMQLITGPGNESHDLEINVLAQELPQPTPKKTATQLEIRVFVQELPQTTPKFARN